MGNKLVPRLAPNSIKIGRRESRKGPFPKTFPRIDYHGIRSCTATAAICRSCSDPAAIFVVVVVRIFLIIMTRDEILKYLFDVGCFHDGFFVRQLPSSFGQRGLLTGIDRHCRRRIELQ